LTENITPHPHIAIANHLRYNTFSDWIEDSLHERDLRSKNLPKDPNSFSGRMSNVPGIVGYLYRALAQLGEEGEGWVVVTLVGT
jgi:hypothetical protein